MFRLKNLLSRKFIAFVVASVLLYMDKIESQIWIIIAGAYIGLNVAQNIVEKIKEKKDTKKSDCEGGCEVC